MEIRCPTCLYPIEMARLEAGGGELDELRTAHSISSVHCPNCGLVQLPKERDETISFEPSHDGLEGSKVAHFSLVRFLGQGASGRVWLADDTILERQVALKLPGSQGGEALSLLHEAQTAAHLTHQNIVSVYEVGNEDGQIFIATEYIDGLTLKDLLSTGTPAVSVTIETMVAVALALHHAHEQGVVHRDVKPGNIIMNSEGRPFVTDFGLAKRISKEETISSEGRVLGTARYMSPEQASGKTRETDHRSDIYAIGVILFEMLTGHAPFRGNLRALLHQKVYEDAPSPRKLAPTLPKDLETICLKCLERDPAKRYQTAKEVAEELKRFSEGEPIKARPISSVERGWRWCRRRPAVAGLLASLILSLSAGLLGVSFFYWQAWKSAELTRRSLYRSQMNLAAEFLEKGDILGVRQTLNRVVSDDRLAVLRGFEWRYYDALIAPFVQIVNQGDVVGDVAVCPEGDVFAATGADRSIHVWDAETGKVIRTLTLDAGRFQAIDFSPVNHLLLSGSSDGMVRIWSLLKDGQMTLEVKHGPPVVTVQFSPKGGWFLAAGSSGPVRVWDAAAGTIVAEIPAGKSGVKDVSFSPDGKSVAIAAQDGRIRVLDIESGMVTVELTPDPYIESLTFSDDGQTIATGSYGSFVRIWSASDGTLRDVYDMNSGRIGDLEFLRNSPVLAIVASDGRLHFYDTAKQVEIRKLNTHNLTDGVLSRSHKGGFLAVGSGDGSVKLLRIDRSARPNTFWHAKHVRSIDFLPDGRRLVAASGDGAIRIWDVERGELQDLTAGTGREISTVSAQHEGRLIATAGVAPRVALWDAESGESVHEIQVPESGIAGVAFSSSGRQLAVATRLGGCFLYDSKDWSEPRFEIEARETAVHSLVFSPDDRHIVVGYEDGEVHFVDAATGVVRAHRAQVSAIPLALAFCESGSVLAIGTDIGEIHLYDLAHHRTDSVIKAHTSRVNALATLPDGTTLVSAGRDKVLRLWDTDSGELLTTLFGHERQVFSISVSPDGQTIASGGLEGDIRIWRSRASH